MRDVSTGRCCRAMLWTPALLTPEEGEGRKVGWSQGSGGRSALGRAGERGRRSLGAGVCSWRGPDSREGQETAPLVLL